MESLIEIFVENPMLPEVVQISGLALLTIIVAVAIFLVEKGAVFEFDRIVILNHVIEPKRFLCSVGLIFLPFFFWNLTPCFMKMILFLASLLGFYLLIMLLIRAYKWIDVYESKEYINSNSYRMKLRFKYFSSVEEGVWSDIFKTQLPNIFPNISMEVALIKEFTKRMEKIVDEKDEESLNLLAENLNQIQNSEHISFGDFRVFQILFQSALRNYHKVYPELCSNYARLKHELESVIRFLLQKSLQHGGTSYIFFFKILKEHLKEKCDEQYSERVIKNIANPFFRHVSDSEEHLKIWGCFPEEWKVTEETINSNNVIVRSFLEEFRDWTRERINTYTQEDEVDRKLDEVSKNFFPTVDTVTWAIILTFYCSSFHTGQRLKTLVERRRKFGHYHRVFVFRGKGTEQEYQDKIGEQRKNAIDLALLIFPEEFAKENIEKYIEELNGLTYEEESLHSRQNEIKQIFEDMLSASKVSQSK